MTNTTIGNAVAKNNSSDRKPPDGGYGWMIVFCGFLINLIGDGITFSFGILFIDFLSYFKQSKSKTAWIGSLFMGIPLISGPVASVLIDHFGCRNITVFGSVIASIGFIISSFCTTVAQLFFSFGIMSAFGLALCDVAGVIIIAYYFENRISLATGFAVSGTGLGTFIMAPFTQHLTETYGWRGALMILSGVILNISICGVLMGDVDYEIDTKSDKYTDANACNDFSDKKLNENNASANYLCSSVVSLPTYLKQENLLNTNIILQNKQDICCPESCNELGIAQAPTFETNHLNDESIQKIKTQKYFGNEIIAKQDEKKYDLFLKLNTYLSKSIQSEYLKILRTTRCSVGYHGAMFKLKCYQLQTLSCPDIYKNYVGRVTMKKTKNFNGMIKDFKKTLLETFNFSYLLNLKYVFYAISNLLLHTFYDVIYVYIVDFNVTLGYSQEVSSYLISIIGILNFCGLIIIGYFGDRLWINSIFLYSFSMSLSGLFICIIPFFHNYYLIASFAAGYGFFISANYSLTSAILIDLISIEHFPYAYGFLLFIQGIGNLMGPPLVGWIIDKSNFKTAFFTTGLIIIISGMMLLILPFIRKTNI